MKIERYNDRKCNGNISNDFEKDGIKIDKSVGPFQTKLSLYR